MTSKNFLVYLVAVFALFAVFATVSVSAASFGSISNVQVNGVDASGGVNFGQFAGEKVPVLIVFKATASANDVRVKAWISGANTNSVVSDRFDVIAGRTYSQVVLVNVPTDINDVNEPRTLNVLVESADGGISDQKSIELTVQRESYDLQILDVNYDATVNAGDVVPFDIVLKNRGSQDVNDAFVQVSIPALNIQERAYFGDLSPVDQGGDVVTEQDAAERILSLKLPANTPAGVYTVQVDAADGDSSDTVTQKIAVTGASANTQVISPENSKTLNPGQTGEYSMTFVNTGTDVEVYKLSLSQSDNLKLSLSDSVVVVPAGSSKTVNVDATAQNAGTYDFTVTVSSDSNVVSQQSFTANVQGSSTNGTGDATIVLTIILAIIFVVLLVVLIVLLTRKPQKTEEFGESYY